MTFLDPQVANYLTDLAAVEHDDPVLLEMERRADEHGFPIVGRAVGRYLEVAARAIGARRVFELGSGFGYSAYWFAGAVGPRGEVTCTDLDPENADLAEDYLRRAGRFDPVRYRVGDALEQLAATDGEFDIVYCDVDKDGYPECWRAARDRIRVGGLFICDNVLWGGLVATGEDRPHERFTGWTAAIHEMNRAVAEDPDYAASIVPIRDGVLTALRLA